jgi:hypothetical protein
MERILRLVELCGYRRQGAPRGKWRTAGRAVSAEGRERLVEVGLGEWDIVEMGLSKWTDCIRSATKDMSRLFLLQDP